MQLAYTHIHTSRCIDPYNSQPLQIHECTIPTFYRAKGPYQCWSNAVLLRIHWRCQSVSFVWVQLVTVNCTDLYIWMYEYVYTPTGDKSGDSLPLKIILGIFDLLKNIRIDNDIILETSCFPN